MLSSNHATHLSKLLSYILRHKPSAYEIVLDENGYTNVDELINKLHLHNESISFEILQHIVDTNNKKRFAFNERLSKTRQTLSSIATLCFVVYLFKFIRFAKIYSFFRLNILLSIK